MSMATNGIEREIRELVADIIEINRDQIDPDANLVEALGMDSMMGLEILAALEKKYRIKLPEEELGNITTVNRAVEVTKRYVE